MDGNPLSTEQLMELQDPWERHLDGRPRYPSFYYIREHNPKTKFDLYPTNRHLDIYTKKAALRASPSVVTIISHPIPDDTPIRIGSRIKRQARSPLDDGERIYFGSGTIIECYGVKGSYFSTILTSASLLRRSNGVDPNDIKVDVYVSDGTKYEGKVYACDLHYNLAAITIQSDTSLPVATLRCLDDSISIDPCEQLNVTEEKFFQLRRHSSLFNIVPGDTVIALGRYFEDLFELMIAPGIYSIDSCKHDCRELLRANCRVTKSGIGGPLINCYGEVIGIAFYDDLCTPFLPVNIVLRWWKHCERFREFCRPWLGMQITNLYAANVHVLDQTRQKFPGTFKGVIVEKVEQNSPAYCAGIHPQDIIIQCDGKFVQGSLEFFEEIWDKAGVSVELVVLRASDGDCLNLTMMVGDTPSDKFNSWPLPFSCLAPRKNPTYRFS